MRTRRHTMTPLVVAATATLLATACGAPQNLSPQPAARAKVTVTNCGETLAVPASDHRIFAYDDGAIAMLLALGAAPDITAIASFGRGQEVLRRHYPERSALRTIAEKSMPSKETLVAERPNVVVAGWNYGYKEATGVTPQTLRARGIAAYTLSESCRPTAGRAQRGTMPPWDALGADLTNLGAITGRSARASEVLADISHRRQALDAAPRAATPPRILVFDSGDRSVFTSGRFGAPQGIIEAAGAENVTADIADSWTTVSWEAIAGRDPHAIAIVDYPGQSFEQKVRTLQAHPATRDLPAVREGRFIGLPYALWVSSPLNIDAAEHLRAALADWGLSPATTIRPPQAEDRVQR